MKITEVYSEPCQTYKMKPFPKVVNSFYQTIFKKTLYVRYLIRLWIRLFQNYKLSYFCLNLLPNHFGLSLW